MKHLPPRDAAVIAAQLLAFVPGLAGRLLCVRPEGGASAMPPRALTHRPETWYDEDHSSINGGIQP